MCEVGFRGCLRGALPLSLVMALHLSGGAVRGVLDDWTLSVVPKFLFNRCPTCKASSEEIKAAQQTPQSLLGGECLPCVWTIGAKHSHAWIQQQNCSWNLNKHIRVIMHVWFMFNNCKTRKVKLGHIYFNTSPSRKESFMNIYVWQILYSIFINQIIYWTFIQNL